MKKNILCCYLALSALSLPSYAMQPLQESLNHLRSSILQTAIVPYLESQDCSNQLQAAQSEIQSLIDACSSCGDPACASTLESVQEELAVTQESYLDSLSTIDSLEQELDKLGPIPSLIDEVSMCDAQIEATQESVLDTLTTINSLTDELSSCDSLVDITETALQEALQELEIIGRVTKIAAGVNHTVLLLEDGSIWAAGENQDGQLGTGDTFDRAAFTRMVTDPSDKFIDIAASERAEDSLGFTIALKDDGTAWATGSNGSGQLGIGSTSTKLTLTSMSANNTDIIAVAAGGFHTLVLKSDGTVWVTGDNTYGQLGLDAPETQTLVLTKMTTNNSDITAIAAGGYHSVVLKNDGTVYATGNNQFGQLGLDSSETQTLVLTQMATDLSFVGTAIAAGLGHTVVLKNDGTVWATGYNQYGQLGLDSLETQTLILTEMTLNNGNITALSAGYLHSIVLKSDGTVWATGDNSKGQLGLDSLETQTLVLTKMTLNNSDISAIAAGAYHSVALKSDGTTWATGDNSSGQLARGFKDASIMPSLAGTARFFKR